jgi:hypothetical protein
MKKIIPTLSVVVTYVPGTGRCKEATRISIRVGGSEVAHKTVGLRWSKDAAEKEWKRNCSSFTITEPGMLKLAA